jgi:hypothetical protein
MLRRRREVATSSEDQDIELEQFHEWVLSLPWVVERPYEAATSGVRCFGVECEPLGRRQVWLLTGLSTDEDARGLAVILPSDVAVDIDALGWGEMIAALSDRNTVVALNRTTLDRYQKIEALVLTAYGHAMS